MGARELPEGDATSAHNAAWRDAIRGGQAVSGAGRSDATDAASQVAGELLEPQAHARLGLARLTTVIAEPGMGKTYLAKSMLRQAKLREWQTYSYTYQDMSSETACSRLVRCCRTLASRHTGETRTLVVFDGIAPGNELEVAREARALENLSSPSIQVMVCLRPEAEQLAEVLPQATCLRADDLLFRANSNADGAFGRTGGIPVLVSAFRADEAMGEDDSFGGKRYARSLEQLVGASLREGLPDEELRARFAMMLLGNGTMEEVRMVAGRCDREMLYWLERDVPLLGVDARQQTFCCHGLSEDCVFERCSEVLHAHAASEGAVVVRACGVLAARENVRRSAIVSRLCATESDHASVCVSWGVSYVAAGEAQLVSDALRTAKLLGIEAGPRGVMSAAAAASVVGTARQVDAAWNGLATLRLTSSVEERLLRRLQLLGTCRDCLRNPRLASRYLGSEVHDTVGLACLDHLMLVRQLSAGSFEECYASLSNEMVLRDPGSLPEAMVCDDLRLALALCGVVPDRKERHLLERANAFFAHPGSGRLKVYHEAIASMPAILMSSGCNAQPVEEAASRAERAGDSFMQALCLIVCAVADLRAHALARAHVRAEGGGRLARALGEEYLASSAELVDAIALTMLGEQGCLGSFCSREERPLGLGLVGRALACLVDEREPRKAGQVIPDGMPCPRNVLWLLNLVSTGCEGAFGQLGDLVPLEWVELVRTVKYRQARAADQVEAVKVGAFDLDVMQGGAGELGRGGQMEMQLVEERQGSVRVSVLGRFEVRRDGQALPEGTFERRRARELISLLALAPGHRLYRNQAIELLWPNDEYLRGPRRLYEAVGEARKRLAGDDPDANPVLADRVQGTIGFDQTLVSCDVDDFEREAKMVLSEEGDDFLLIEHARRMERLYATGVDASLITLGAPVADRAEGLCDLFVDALVAAGEASLRLGKAKMAVRYGMDAHHQRVLREDAVMLAARALKAAGRGFEIPDFYRRYTKMLYDAEGVAPSMALRRVIDLLIGGDPYGDGSQATRA